MANKFPKVLFVKFEDGGTDPDYLAADSDLYALAEMGIKHKVGIYRLDEVTDVEGVVRTGQSKQVRR